MTTPSGQISLNDVNVELGFAGTTLISMNDANVRTLAGVPSGAISMQNLQGKSNRVALSYTFSSPATATTVNVSALGGYSSGKTDATITVNSNVYVYSTSTGSYGLTISGATTGDTVTLVNNGFIMGQGGAGGRAWVPGPGNPSAGSSGGGALDLSIGVPAITITNTSGYIGGGGGGGGARDSQGGGGGGAGGAGGGSSGSTGGAGVVPGGNGGNIGAAGNNGATNQVPSGKQIDWKTGGGGGGRIIPGTGGQGGQNQTDPGGGGGSGGGGGATTGTLGGAGGSGGSAGQGGPAYSGGGGGGWGASGGSAQTGGGSGGKAVNVNGKSITWTSGPASTSRVYGAIS